MKIIGFDFDGVFINIENEKAKLFGDVVHKYWDIDPDVASKVWLDKLGTSRKHKFEILFWDKNHKKVSDENYYNIERIFSSILIKDYYPGAAIINETFEIARDMNSNFDLAFVSSGVSNLELNVLATKLEIDIYFDYILGTDEKFMSKRDHFHMISQKTSYSKGIFIGDGLEDMRIAKEFDFIAIGLPANHSPKKMLDAGADFICEYSQLRQKIINLSID